MYVISERTRIYLLNARVHGQEVKLEEVKYFRLTLSALEQICFYEYDVIIEI